MNGPLSTPSALLCAHAAGLQARTGPRSASSTERSSPVANHVRVASSAWSENMRATSSFSAMSRSSHGRCGAPQPSPPSLSRSLPCRRVPPHSLLWSRPSSPPAAPSPPLPHHNSLSHPPLVSARRDALRAEFAPIESAVSFAPSVDLCIGAATVAPAAGDEGEGVVGGGEAGGGEMDDGSGAIAAALRLAVA